MLASFDVLGFMWVGLHGNDLRECKIIRAKNEGVTTYCAFVGLKLKLSSHQSNLGNSFHPLHHTVPSAH